MMNSAAGQVDPQKKLEDELQVLEQIADPTESEINSFETALATATKAGLNKDWLAKIEQRFAAVKHKAKAKREAAAKAKTEAEAALLESRLSARREKPIPPKSSTPGWKK